MKLQLFLLVFTTAYLSRADVCKVNYSWHLFVHLTPEQAEKAIDICTECSTQQDVKPEELSEVDALKMEYPSKPLKCYYRCYFQKYGVMDLQGNYDVEAMAQYLYEPYLDIIKKCLPIGETDLCESAYNLYTCCLSEWNRIGDFL